jgi:hypothetical protein
MASLQRAVLMLRKLNLYGIPRDIRDNLRQLQDAYSEELDLNCSDTSSQGSIEPGGAEAHEYEERREKSYEDERQASTKSQQDQKEQISTSGNLEQGYREHTVNKEGRKSTIEEHSVANLEVDFLHPNLRHNNIGSILKSGNSSYQPWRWGPSATSNDAAKFFRRVV